MLTAVDGNVIVMPTAVDGNVIAMLSAVGNLRKKTMLSAIDRPVSGIICGK